MTTRLNCKQSWRSQVSEPSKRERLSSWLMQILLEQSHPSGFIFPAFFVARETWKPNDSIQNKTCFCSCAEWDRWNKLREGRPTNWKIWVSQALWRGITVGRGKKRKEDRTPTQPGQQSSQAVAIAVTQTAPATHTQARNCSLVLLHAPSDCFPRSFTCPEDKHARQLSVWRLQGQP